MTKKNKETRVREAEILDPASVYSREDDGGISTAGTGEEEKENPWALGRRDFFCRSKARFQDRAWDTPTSLSGTRRLKIFYASFPPRFLTFVPLTN